MAYKTEDVVKVHVHTFNPGAVLTMAQKYGEFLTLKIENMSLGHSEEEKPQPKKRKKYAVVTVASGDGLSALFRDMGANVLWVATDGVFFGRGYNDIMNKVMEIK